MAFNSSPDKNNNGNIDFTSDIQARVGSRPLLRESRPHAAPQRINPNTGFQQPESPMGSVLRTTGKVGIGVGVGGITLLAGVKTVELVNNAINATQRFAYDAPRLMHPVNVADSTITTAINTTERAVNYLGNPNATGPEGWAGLGSLILVGGAAYLVGTRIARPTINRFRGHNHSDTIDD